MLDMFDSGSISEASATSEAPIAFDHSARRSRLRALMAEVSGTCPMEAMAICDPLDVGYFSGVREGVSWLVVGPEGGFAVTRHMLVREVMEEIGDFDVLLPSERSTDAVKLEAFVVAEMKRRGIRSVAVDTGRMGAGTFLRFQEAAAEMGLEVGRGERWIEGLRQCKEPMERQWIERCVEIAEEAFRGLLEEGAAGLVGRSERELARELENRMIGLGADRQGFPETGIIVASGPHSASAHHTPGSRMAAWGEALLIDWGAELGGYRSDLTRTLYLGSVPEYARKAHPVVEAALHAAEKVLRPGAEMGWIDAAARETVMAAGYPEFHYGVGHGVGLAIHEGPWLRAHSREILESGMITTVEPGVYLADIGGIRLEGMFAVGADSVDRLDRLPTDLAAMVIE
ncbi:Xaa-Pro aminopeptidase [Haloferula luteola]|uniref:Xaa-Pro aminopeptidase n=1 Tax=Haloferula luteola TaxID=595692 RepID=A0A840V242_9BACT|nr:M24 family metallopeptidase [Haloferula luteola]MBB5351493.1 Xaa-Pro aminopeptidase [Haloferula luteola]